MVLKHKLNVGISSPAQWNHAKGVLEINPKSSFWKDLQGHMLENKKSKLTSTDSMFHVIWHEYSHYKVFKTSNARYKVLQNKRFSEFDKEWIKEEVSEDACENALEFVAEVEAMIKTDRQVSPKALKLYEQLMEDL